MEKPQMFIEFLQPYRPLLGASAYDGGGREVVGWLHCPRWRALLGWIPLLIERNVQGCLPYNTNPEPWPGYYDGIEQTEISHLNSPWHWNGIEEQAAVLALARTLRDVRRVYPMATPEQIQDVLMEAGVI
jgi:hypothetical protein